MQIGTFLRFAPAAAHKANRVTLCLFLALCTSGDCQHTRPLGSIVHSVTMGASMGFIGFIAYQRCILYPVCFVVLPMRRPLARLHFSQVHLYGLRDGRMTTHTRRTRHPITHRCPSRRPLPS
jgi:hypothetical protein